MAGIKQHDLPNFLLKGFPSHTCGRQVYTWQFRLGEAPRKDNTDRVHPGRYFYGRPGEFSIDDRQTVRENDFARMVHEIRRHGALPTGADRLIPEFVSNITFRTRHVRKFILELARSVSVQLREEFRRPDNARRFVSAIFERELTTRVRKQAAVEALPGELTKAISAIALAGGERFFQIVVDEADSFFPAIEGGLLVAGGTVKRAHLQALEPDTSPESARKYCEGLEWSVVTNAGATLILGDVAVLSICPGTAGVYDLSQQGQEARHLVLPISNAVLLLGRHPGARPPAIAFDAVNRASASLSCELFVSSMNSEREHEYHSLLGSGLREKSTELANQAVASVLKSRLFG